MNKVQLVIAVLSAVGFLFFIAPVFTERTANIGNVTGMLITGGIFFYGLFMQKVHHFIKDLCINKSGKAFVGLIGIVLLGVMLTAAAETIFMIKAAQNRPPENVTAVVLGCRVKGDRPSLILKERIEAAYRYLSENPKAFCILSGGKGEDENISEAQCMYQCLTEMGISGERLILEDRSVSTRENLEFSAQIIKEKGLPEEVVIITSEFHSYRAELIAKKRGLKSYSYPAHTFFVCLATYYVRELYGILQQWIFNG